MLARVEGTVLHHLVIIIPMVIQEDLTMVDLLLPVTIHITASLHQDILIIHTLTQVHTLLVIQVVGLCILVTTKERPLLLDTLCSILEMDAQRHHRIHGTRFMALRVDPLHPHPHLGAPVL